MAVDVRVGGVAELRAAAAQLRVADKQLDRRIDGGVRRMGVRFAGDVRDGIPRYLPSGYAPTLVSSLKVGTSFKRVGRGAGIRFRVYAMGKRYARQVRSMNDGSLRHPFYGNRERWYATRVKPGFVDDPAKRLAERAADDLLAAVDEAVATATKG